MFAEAHYPEELSSEELDSYLEDGWFRMGQTIFTTSFLYFHNQLYRAIWLRVVLSDFVSGKTFEKFSKLNSAFRIEVNKASITEEKEMLFARYKQGIEFEASESLDFLLQGGLEGTIFNTLEVCLYEGEKLIACGFFDIGKDGAAGISSFYDPDYKKHSLGKYLIYQKLLYCKSQGIKHFYLGYFAPGYPAFDYKLQLSKSSLEYLDLSTQSWLNMDTYDYQIGSIYEIIEKLTNLQKEMKTTGVESRLLHYKYFDANLVRNLSGYKLFDYPLFLYCFEFIPEAINPIIVYDICDKHYHLIKCFSVGMANEIAEHEEEYSAHLLKTEQIVYSTTDPVKMSKMIATALQALL